MLERRWPHVRVAGAHAFQRDRRRARWSRQWVARVLHRRLAVGELENTPSGSEHRRELACRRRQQRDRLERRERQERESRYERAVQLPGRMGGDRDGEHGDGRQAGGEDPECVCGAGGERVTVGEPGQSGISLPKAAKRLLLTPVHDELGCATKELDELGGQLPLRNRPGP